MDFFWINRDQRSFEWFLTLLSQLEAENLQDSFLKLHMYMTSALRKTDMKAVGLHMALDLVHEKHNKDLITGLQTRTMAGRPNWDEVYTYKCMINKYMIVFLPYNYYCIITCRLFKLFRKKVKL